MRSPDPNPFFAPPGTIKPRLATLNGQVLKDEGIARCLKKAHPVWVNGCEVVAYNLPFGWEGTGEDFRFLATKELRLLPHSDKCWGSIMNHFRALGIMEFKTPWVWVVPSDPTSHARPTRVWRRTEFF